MVNGVVILLIKEHGYVVMVPYYVAYHDTQTHVLVPGCSARVLLHCVRGCGA